MAESRHRAIVRSGPGLACRWVPTPTTGPGDVLVRVDRVGICGTDLQILNGSRPDAARILGHEGTGEVMEVGPGGPGGPGGLQGRRVVFNPVNPSDQGEVLGHSYDGLLQEKVLVPSRLVADTLVTVGPGVPPSAAVLAEPLGTVAYGHELVRAVCDPRRVLVVGAGPVGLLHAVYARQAGAEAVFLVNRSPERLAWAVAAGIVRADEAVLASDDNDGRPLAELGRTEIDAAILCTTRGGALAGLRLAMAAVRDGGCVDLVSGLPAEHELNEVRRSNVCGTSLGPAHRPYPAGGGKRVWLTGHRGTGGRHLAEALRLVGGRSGAFERVVTHVVAMADAPALISTLAGGGARRVGGRECVKAVVTFGDPG